MQYRIWNLANQQASPAFLAAPGAICIPVRRFAGQADYLNISLAVSAAFAEFYSCLSEWAWPQLRTDIAGIDVPVRRVNDVLSSFHLYLCDEYSVFEHNIQNSDSRCIFRWLYARINDGRILHNKPAR